jgi:ssRNA-specific RNase YbeY (16S rRNA maturation enzyme)
VLSFPLENNPNRAAVSPDGLLYLGDIVVSWPQARTVAVKSNRLISAVICDLVEHGMKHLLGEHHI